MAKKKFTKTAPAGADVTEANAPEGTPAKKSARKKAVAKKKKGVRYTAEQQAEIVQFVRDHDKANGRGGKASAVKRFGVSALTVSKWLKGTGTKRRSKAETKKGRKPAKAERSGKVGSDSMGRLKRMLAIRGTIDELEAEFAKLKKVL